jgi:hypothetical protein
VKLLLPLLLWSWLAAVPAAFVQPGHSLCAATGRVKHGREATVTLANQIYLSDQPKQVQCSTPAAVASSAASARFSAAAKSFSSAFTFASAAICPRVDGSDSSSGSGVSTCSTTGESPDASSSRWPRFRIFHWNSERSAPLQSTDVIQPAMTPRQRLWRTR